MGRFSSLQTASMVDVVRERKEGMEGEDATEGGAHFQLGFIKLNSTVLYV